MSSGWLHALALREDGHIVAWGDSHIHQIKAPLLPKGSSYVSMSAGVEHSLGLLDNGTVLGWGLDNHGQATGGAAALPRGRRYVQVAAGQNAYSLGLLDDGRPVFWGFNGIDMLNETARVSQEIAAGRLLRLVAISAGASHALGLQENGQVV